MLSFYTYFDCKKEGCELANDTLSIIVKGTDDYLEVYRNGTNFGRVNDKTWTKEEVEFIVKSSEIKVIINLIFEKRNE